MMFKSIFLIFALAMFMLAGVAWAEDDDDQGEDYGGGASICQLPGDEFHCYFAFALPDGNYAQVMINDSSESVVLDKAIEIYIKYAV